MGNNNPSARGAPVHRASRPDEWVRQGTTGYCDLVRNTQTGQIAEQYSIPVDQRINREEDIRRYEFRGSHPYFVKVLQVEKEDSQQLCQGQDFIRVKTEHIPARLSEVQGLTEPEGLYVLREALNGYKIICQFQGPLKINEEMIGFTQDGQVKVWLNENYARNAPDLENMVSRGVGGYQAQNDAAFIRQLFELIEGRLATRRFSEGIRSRFFQSQFSTFDEALGLVHNYAAQSGVAILSGIDKTKIKQTAVRAQNQKAVGTTVVSQTQPFGGHVVQQGRPIIAGNQSQLLVGQNPALLQPQPNFSRAISVGALNRHSQLVVGKPMTSTVAPSSNYSRLVTQPVNASVQSQVRFVQDPNYHPNRSLNISSRLGPQVVTPQQQMVGRQPINFRLTNRQEGSVSVTSKGTEQIQFAQRGATRTVSTNAASIPQVARVNPLATTTEVTQEVKKEVVTVRQENTSTVAAPRQEAVGSSAQVRTSSEVITNATKANTVTSNLTSLVKEAPQKQTFVQPTQVAQETKQPVQQTIQQNTYQVTSQQATQQQARTIPQQQNVVQQQTVQQRVEAQPVRQEATTTTKYETRGEIKEVDITSSPKVIKLESKTIPIERIVHKAGGNSGTKRSDTGSQGQGTPGFSYKFQGSPDKYEARAEVKEIPIYRAGEAKTVGTTEVRRNSLPTSSPATENKRVIQHQQNQPARQVVASQSSSVAAQPHVIVVDERTITENRRGDIVGSHEEVIATEVDARGHSSTSGYVIDYSSEEPEISGGVTYSNTHITDYTVGVDSAGHRYVRGHTYEYNNDNPVKEYERYIDSSTGVDRLQSFRVGENRPRLPSDYQQIVSNTSGSYSASQPTPIRWNYQSTANAQPSTYTTTSSTSQGTKLPSYSELSKNLNSQSGTQTVVLEAPKPVQPDRPVKVKPGLLD